MSTGVRDSVAAGVLYAGDPQDLRSEIDRAVNAAEVEFANPKLLVVPSSGLSAAPRVSGSALAMLETERGNVERVVVIADHHPGVGQRAFAGVAVPRSIAFRTPLGDLLVDREMVAMLQQQPQVVVNDRPFVSDMNIEVQLPPLQRLLGSVRIVPLLVGDISRRDLVDLLERIWGDRRTLIVVSSTFGAAGTDVAPEPGGAVRSAFEQNDAASVEASDASAARTLAALLVVIARRSMGLLELDHEVITESGAVAARNVSIASWAAWESPGSTLPEAEVAHLRSLAESVVRATVLGARVTGSDPTRIPPALTARRASVLTLRRDGQIRGSAGTIEADRSLAGSVIRNAAAACADPRLPSLQLSEVDGLELTISVVSPIERIFAETWSDLASLVEPGRHGMLVLTPEARAAHLPATWARVTGPQQFVSSLATKVGLDPSSKIGTASWYRFETTEY